MYAIIRYTGKDPSGEDAGGAGWDHGRMYASTNNNGASITWKGATIQYHAQGVLWTSQLRVNAREGVTQRRVQVAGGGRRTTVPGVR